MTRASEKPKAWKQVLKAMDKNEDDLASRIVKENGFFKDVSPSGKRRIFGRKYLFSYESPDGQKGSTNDLNQLSEIIGMQAKSINSKFSAMGDVITWAEGSRAGWVVERFLRERVLSND